MSAGHRVEQLGFLTCTEFDGWGLCGGLLLLNTLARPLEFHCTLPVKVSRTQAILYGASLRAHVCGQVIGRALLDKAKTVPQLLLTDCWDTAQLPDNVDTPMVFVPPTAPASAAAEVDSVDLPPVGMAPAAPPMPWDTLTIRDQTVWLLAPDTNSAVDSRRWIEAALTQFTARHDLAEPFDRVRQAMTEARDAALRAA